NMMADAERPTEGDAIAKNGRLAESETPEQRKGTGKGGDVLKLTLNDGSEFKPDLLREFPEIHDVKQQDNKIMVFLNSDTLLLPILRRRKRCRNDRFHFLRYWLRYFRRGRRRRARLPSNPPDLKTTVHHWSCTRRSAKGNNLHHSDVPCRRCYRGFRTTALDPLSSPLSLPVGLWRYGYVNNCRSECEERQQIRRGPRSS